MLALGLLASVICYIEALPATVRPNDRRMYVDGAALHIKGVNWNPVPKGSSHPRGLQFSEHAELDAKLMAEAGVNVIRTYEAIDDPAVLDILWNHSIQVINTVYSNYVASVERVAGKVNKVKHHPAILMWAVGNEWNYNGCYAKQSRDVCGDRLNEVAAIIKKHDPKHPVASVYGEVPPVDVIQRLNNIDVWGINYYDDVSFGDLFTRYAARTTKPMFIGEYGADAYHAQENREDEDSQAYATKLLTQELMDNSALWEHGVCSGGLIFELADEWWKDGAGSDHVHDVGGIAPGGGPHPDRVFNEEWWGLTTVDRTPRKAYFAFAAVAVPQPKLAMSLMVQGGNATEGMRKSCTLEGCTLVPRQREDSKGCVKVMSNDLLKVSQP
eukprot:TRINITY_DN109634_c0_g1_i1.p1 TRINITY_DN109634_c0_g1~~TRINITY_DN109634_c0_g1_i1.p1  ORF type:complete len:384 (+),score=78.38 TRINITY_DN109634_c0_g1_i1:99-1250(+)